MFFPQVRPEFADQISAAFRRQIDAAPQHHATQPLFRRRLPYLRRNGPRSKCSGDLAERNRLASARIGNDHRRLDDISESLKKIAVADAKVAIVLVVNRRKSQLYGVIEEVLRVLGAEPLCKSALGPMPFVREISRLFEACYQDVRENRGGPDQGLQILLYTAFAIERSRRLGGVRCGESFDCRSQVLRENTAGSA